MKNSSIQGLWHKIMVATALALALAQPVQASDQACSQVIFDLGIVAGYTTLKATPDGMGNDRWVKNLRLAPLFEAQIWGQVYNYYDWLFGYYSQNYAEGFEYLTPEVAARDIKSRYDQIFTVPRACEFTLSGSTFTFSRANRLCELTRNAITKILELNCMPVADKNRQLPGR